MADPNATLDDLPTLESLLASPEIAKAQEKIRRAKVLLNICETGADLKIHRQPLAWFKSRVSLFILNAQLDLPETELKDIWAAIALQGLRVNFSRDRRYYRGMSTIAFTKNSIRELENDVYNMVYRLVNNTVDAISDIDSNFKWWLRDKFTKNLNKKAHLVLDNNEEMDSDAVETHLTKWRVVLFADKDALAKHAAIVHTILGDEGRCEFEKMARIIEPYKPYKYHPDYEAHVLSKDTLSAFEYLRMKLNYFDPSGVGVFYKELFEEMRLLHAADQSSATVIEDSMCALIAYERSRPVAWVDAFFGDDIRRGKAEDFYLNILHEMNADKAREITSFQPARTVFNLAVSLTQASLPGLRALDDAARKRAFELLNHFKYAQGPYVRHVGAAIGLLSLTMPLAHDNKARLQGIATEILDRLDKTEFLRTAYEWNKTDLEGRSAYGLIVHELACDAMGLPCKLIDFIDADDLQPEEHKDSAKSTLGLYRHKASILIAAGPKIPLVKFIESIVHENWHQQHALVGFNILTAASGLARAAQAAQDYLTNIFSQTTKDPALNHAMYRGKIMERESHYLDGLVGDRLNLLLDQFATNPRAHYILTDSVTVSVPTGALITLVRQVPCPKTSEFEREADLDVMVAETMIFDIAENQGKITIYDVEWASVSSLESLEYLQAAFRQGIAEVSVRCSKDQVEAVKTLVADLRSYPLVPKDNAPAIPTYDEVFRFSGTSMPLAGLLPPPR